MADNQLLRMLRGQEVNLHDVDPGLHRVRVGIGWHAPEQDHGFPVDLDSSAFLLGRDGRVRRDTDFVFYNNLESDGGVIRHLGDNLTGEGDAGDDRETIDINLEGLHFDIEKVAFSVSIHNADERQQNFGLVHDAYIRILNLDTKVELARFDLTQGAATDNAFLFGELYRVGMGWRFLALGQGSNGGLYKIARDFNVNVAPV
jgi:tellurium resistance protein TerD